MTIKKTPPVAKKLSSDKRQCTKCGKMHKEEDFYMSKSMLYVFYGRLTICKDCIDEIYQEYVRRYETYKKATYELCKLLDYPFLTNTYDGADKDASKRGLPVYKFYFQKLNSLGASNNSGNCFNDGEQIYQDDIVSVSTLGAEVEGEINGQSVLDWGTGYSFADYVFLDNFYSDLIGTYACDTPIQDKLYRNIAKIQLMADRALVVRDTKTYKDMMDTLSKMLNDANIKPAQSNTANADSLGSYGMWIKHIENDEPVPEAIGEFKDPDGIMYYIQEYFVKHFKRIFGLMNEYDENTVPNMEDIKDTFDEEVE